MLLDRRSQDVPQGLVIGEEQVVLVREGAVEGAFSTPAAAATSLTVTAAYPRAANSSRAAVAMLALVRALRCSRSEGLDEELMAARAAAAHGAQALVAGRSSQAVGHAAREVGGEPVVVDLTRLDDVRALAEALPAIDAVALNAGLEVVTGASRTVDGFETTFQVNHLAQLLLLDLLLARSQPPTRVVLTGSGTHDASRRTGMPRRSTATSVRGPTRRTARRRPVWRVGVATPPRNCSNAATAAALAQEHPDIHVTCLDAGLMLGTGLSRDYPAVVRSLTTVLSPALAALLPGASTPQASGRVLAWLLLDVTAHAASGAYVDHHLRTVAASPKAQDTAFGASVLRDSRALLAQAAGL